VGLTTLVTGAGDPVTVVAHGFGASLAETRPLLSGVPGTRVLVQARGHGTSAAPVAPGYAELAADLARVADERGATQALGVSMGAGTLLRLLTAVPDRFARVVLFLPAALDRPRDDPAVRRVAGLSGALAAADRPGVEASVREELPTDLTGPAVDSYVTARTDFLLASPGLPALLAALVDDCPVPDRTALAAVSADVLLLAQEQDPLHPAQVARELAGLLPRARLVVFDRPGVVFRERARLRALVSAHLTPA
jgi:3-oxoadipate enol-lactonase